MRRFGFIALFLFAVPLAAQRERQETAPEIPYHVDPDFLKLPDNFYFGRATGVALDSKGNIYVANRGNHPLVEFGADGTFLRSIAEGLNIFGAPHSVRIDAQDNIWYVDAEYNELVRFDSNRRLRFILGGAPEPWVYLTHVFEFGARSPSAFYQPTDVTWGPDGVFWVSDGYGNSRVAKFDQEGKLLKSWGERGMEPGQFNTPHQIVRDVKGTLYVADRGNARIQLFDADGNFLKLWNNIGPPWALCITPGPNQVIFAANGVSGRIYKLSLDGKILGWFGKWGKMPGEFEWVHGLACPNESTVYAAEELNWRVEKLVLAPTP